jgi:hypothetical protein
MKDYDEKKLACMRRQLYRCPVCGESVMHQNIMLDLHHRMRNTKGNRKRYPLLIDSIENLEAVHHTCHIDHHGSCGKLTDLEAEAIEKMMRSENGLQSFPAQD